MYDYRNELPIDRLSALLLALTGIYGALLAGAEGQGFGKRDCEGLSVLVLMVAIALGDVEKDLAQA